MKSEHKQILTLLEHYLKSHPEQRFGQALFNLGVNEFVQPMDHNALRHQIRDIHGDADNDILQRMKHRLEWFALQQQIFEKVSAVDTLAGMTVNERLYVTGLFDLFDKYRSTNERFARHILSVLEVSSSDIDKILKK